MTDGPVGVGLRHQALTYRGGADPLPAVLSFIQDGLAADDAVLLGASAGVTRVVREALRERWRSVTSFDMLETGRNPGRIIATMWDFASRHAGRPVRFVSEPFWPARSAAEAAEATRHEVLVNHAFAGADVTALCLYDTDALDPAVVARAGATHPQVIFDGQVRASPHYLPHAQIPAEYDSLLEEPPAGADFLAYRDDLRPARALVALRAKQAGLSADRTADLVLAVSEVTANTLRHTRGDGELRVWLTAQEIICQIQDQGHIADPLAGRRRGDSDTSGHGLWVVHQVCDLVELRTGPSGTVLRLHVGR